MIDSTCLIFNYALKINTKPALRVATSTWELLFRAESFFIKVFYLKKSISNENMNCENKMILTPLITICCSFHYILNWINIKNQPVFLIKVKPFSLLHEQPSNKTGNNKIRKNKLLSYLTLSCLPCIPLIFLHSFSTGRSEGCQPASRPPPWTRARQRRSAGSSRWACWRTPRPN